MQVFQSMIKALVKLARGSGLHKTYGRILELRRDANLSMSKLPERLFLHSMKSLLRQRPFIQHSECSGFLVSLNIVRPGSTGAESDSAIGTTLPSQRFQAVTLRAGSVHRAFHKLLSSFLATFRISSNLLQCEQFLVFYKFYIGVAFSA